MVTRTLNNFKFKFNRKRTLRYNLNDVLNNPEYYRKSQEKYNNLNKLYLNLRKNIHHISARHTTENNTYTSLQRNQYIFDPVYEY